MTMADERRKKELRTKIFRRIGIVMLIVFVTFVSRGVMGVFKKNQIAMTAREAQFRRLDRLSTRHGELTTAVRRLESERGLEEELRSSFPVALPGEGVVVITEEPSSAIKETTKKNVTQTFFERIRGWFIR
ncbi:MAG: hypothetical protein Q8Q18_01805 [bacterium]|nr:hypothetical protein [bacterium]